MLWIDLGLKHSRNYKLHLILAEWQEKQGFCIAFGTTRSKSFKQDQNNVNVSMNLYSFNRMHTIEIKGHKGRRNILEWEIVLVWNTRNTRWSFELLFQVSQLETLTWEVTNREVGKT